MIQHQALPRICYELTMETRIFSLSWISGQFPKIIFPGFQILAMLNKNYEHVRYETAMINADLLR